MSRCYSIPYDIGPTLRLRRSSRKLPDGLSASSLHVAGDTSGESPD